MNALLSLALFVLPMLMLLAPGKRRALAAAMAVVGAALLPGLDAESPRALEIRHGYTGFEGNEIAWRTYPVETTTGDAWAWIALGLAWAIVWAAWGLLAGGGAVRAFRAALALGWLGAAVILVWQKVAAPAAFALGLDLGLVVPPLELALWPAAAAGAILIARSAATMPQFLLMVSLLCGLLRLPVAIFGTLATRNGWGTWLDVHGVDFVAVLGRAMELEPRSTEQLTWVLWLPQLLIMPALTMLSAGSVGFFVYMARQQRAENAAAAR